MSARSLFSFVGEAGTVLTDRCFHSRLSRATRVLVCAALVSTTTIAAAHPLAHPQESGAAGSSATTASPPHQGVTQPSPSAPGSTTTDGHSSAGGRIVITEVMYNPASDEKRGEPEWVEIMNVGTAPVVLDGWKLDDEDTRALDDWSSFSITLAPGAIAVLINGDAVTETDFRAAWDDPSEPANYAVVPVSWGGISNNPSETNEVLRLLDGAGAVVCEVNLRNGDGWPRLSTGGGPSIYLTAPTAPDVNDGSLWKASEAGVAGALVCRQVSVFTGRDIGSPGRVPTGTATARESTGSTGGAPGGATKSPDTPAT